MSDVDTATLHSLFGVDSVEFLIQQENAWINEQILLKEAQVRLSDSEKDKTKELEEYKNNLMLYSLRENLVLSELDTFVSDEEISKYYKENKANFELKRNIAKILFVKVIKEKYKKKVNKWMKDYSGKNIELLNKYCREQALNYYLSDSTWLLFDDIWKEIPISKTYNRERFLNSNKFLTFEEGDYIYLLKILDFRIKNDLSPLEFEQDKIKQIVLNKRRISLIKEKEKELIRQAYSNGDVKIFREK